MDLLATSREGPRSPAHLDAHVRRGHVAPRKLRRREVHDALRSRRALAPRAAALVPDRAPMATSSSFPSRWASACCSVTASTARSAKPKAIQARARSAASRSRPDTTGSAIATASSSSRTTPGGSCASGMMTVRSLVRARDGTIWAAAGTGLHAHRDGSWVNVNAVEGLPDGAVYDVLQDRTGVDVGGHVARPRAPALRRRHGHAGDAARSGAESARDAAERRDPAGVHGRGSLASHRRRAA